MSLRILGYSRNVIVLAKIVFVQELPGIINVTVFTFYVPSFFILRRFLLHSQKSFYAIFSNQIFFTLFCTLH